LASPDLAASAQKFPEARGNVACRKGEAGAMVLQPALAKVAPGDTIAFIPADTGFNAETIPLDAARGLSRPSKARSIRRSRYFDVPGRCGVECAPHFGLRMVALIFAGGDTGNVEAAIAVKVPKKPGSGLKPSAP
jgi:pseudoazurin